MELYHDKQRLLQDKYDSRRLADVIATNNAHDAFNPLDLAFIAAQDFFFLATADADGKPSCSFKAGTMGFVKVVDDKTLAFPCYDGNGMFLSMGNVLANQKVGLLFIDFQKPNRLRISGTATLIDNDPLLADYPEAMFMVRVAVTEIYLNCPRYIPKMARVNASPFIPVAGKTTPFPSWKQIDFVRDTLPSRDLKAVADKPVITIMDYIDEISAS
jgi:uncharacterized protein